MRKVTFLGGALCLVAIALLFMLTAGAPTAQAQGCNPCATWWVNYDYIFPPCNIPVTVEVEWQNGQKSLVTSSTDGHIIYPTPNPISAAKKVKVNGVEVPINGIPVWLPYGCDGIMPNQCLRVEIRCNPCLEVKIKLEPCPPPACQACPTWWVEYDYIFPPCTIPVSVDVDWQNGQTSHVTSTTDGHIIYNTPNPITGAVAVRVNGAAVPIGGGPIWIPYACDGVMPNQCLRVEVRCNPCLEVKIHLEPCP